MNPNTTQKKCFGKLTEEWFFCLLNADRQQTVELIESGS